ncbi:MAG: 16S rRNA (guanine(966)-N(2))-methyltransferase RsmD [Acidobacteria bacterium]|nr:16S rRNA (guanine(966)-N(2))-methyltransferase RsmD [Acidobacteriota bacterium]
MRIISGQFRGLLLKTLRGGKLRPTSDQLRETLFDVLGPNVEGARFLDAYAGSGAVGIEALSRGAADVVFVEQHRPAAELIRQNLARLKIDSGYWILTTSVISGLEKLSGQGEQFDFIFVDPPYDSIREYHQTLRELGRGRLLTASSLVVAEHSLHVILEDEYVSLRRTRTIRHGDAQLSFYRAA